MLALPSLRSAYRGFISSSEPDPRRHRSTLGIVLLEDRIVPADFRDISGLRFFSENDNFTANGATSTIGSTIQVGIAPQGAEQFVPLLLLPAGVEIDNSGPTTVTVNSSLAVGGLTFTGDNLTFAFDQANSKYSVTGDASFSVNNVEIGVSFGSSNSPGLVIENGSLSSLDVAVTSKFEFSKVTFGTNDLRLKFDTSEGDVYTITGAAFASFQGANNSVDFNVQFGPTAKNAELPGLRIENGVLTDLHIGITSDFKIAGLEVSTKNLSFFYNRDAETFGMFGTVRVSTAQTPGGSRVLDNFGVTLGKGSGANATPGILVKNGTLERIDFTLNGAINLASLTVQPENLRTVYTRTSGLLQFTGGLRVSLARQFDATVSLPNGGIVINTTTGAVLVNGIRLDVTQAKIGPVVVRNSFIEYTDDGQGSFNLSGSATVDLPAGLTVGGSFNVVSGQLQSISINARKDPGFPIGNTGVFANLIELSLTNLDNPGQLQLTGTMGFTGGPSFRLAGAGRAFIAGTVTVNLDVGDSKLVLSGEVTLLGDLIKAGSGSIVFDYDENNPSNSSVTATLNQNYMNGLVRTTFTIGIAGTGSIEVFGSAEVRLPEVSALEGIPVLGDISGASLGSVSIHLKFDADNPESSFIRFNTTFLVARLSVTLGFTGNANIAYSITTFPAINIPPRDVFEPFTGAFLFTIPGSSTPERTIDDSIDFSIPRLIPASVGPPPAPQAPFGYAPSTRIKSVEPGAGTNLLVRIESETLSPDNTVIRLRARSANGATHDVGPFAFQPGTQTVLIPNLGADLPSGEDLEFFATIEDQQFGITRQSDSFFALPLDYRLAITAPTTMTAPPGAEVTFNNSNLVQFTGTLAPIASSTDISVTFSATRGTFSLPLTIGTAFVTGNNTGSITIAGRATDVNQSLANLKYTRTQGQFNDTISISAARLPDVGVGNIIHDISVPKVPFELFTSGLSYVQNSPAVAVFPTPTIVNQSDARFSFFSIELGNYEQGSDFFAANLPAGSPITAIFNSAQGEITLTGLASAEAYLDAIRSITFFSSGIEPSKPLFVNLTDEFGTASVFAVFVTMTVTGPPVVNPGPIVDVPFIDTGVSASFYNGSGPVTFATFLNLLYGGDLPLTEATAFFTDLFDNASDVLSLPANPKFTSAFDATTGRLTITAIGTVTREEFESALRSVTYESSVAHPLAFTRSVSFQITNGQTTSDGNSGISAIVVDVPLLQPSAIFFGIPLVVPYQSEPLAIFPEVSIAGFAAPVPQSSLSLGQFPEGSAFISATVSIRTNFVPDEDVLSVTLAGNITGEYDPTTGILSLSGVGTIAEYESVIRSVKYQNVNPSPSTEERLVAVNLVSVYAQNVSSGILRNVQPLFDGFPTRQTGGVISPLTIEPGTPFKTFGFQTLEYAPRTGATTLIYTIVDVPPSSLGFVQLTNGTVAEAGMVTTIEQLRGAMFVPSAIPRAGVGTFTFTVANINPVTGEPESSPLIRSASIEMQNVAPVAGNDSVAVAGSVPTVISVLTNDADANRDGLVFTELTAPSKGSIQTNEDRTFTYTPGENFAGEDSFTYTVSDGNGGTSTATVAIRVNQPPVAVNDSATTTTNTPITIAVLANDTDPDGHTLTILTATAAANGQLAITDKKTITYTPLPEFTGSDKFSYTISDGNGGTSTASVSVSVTAPVSPPPVSPPPTTGRSPNLVGVPVTTVGPDAGSPPVIRRFDATGKELSSTEVFDPSFTGGVRTATADFNGDGVQDVIAGTGPGIATQVKILDGSTGNVLFDLAPFEAAFTGGIYVAVGDVNGDGVADLAITPDEGGGPRVRIFNGKNFTEFADFFGIDDENFRGGARASFGDVNGDGVADLVVSAGFLGGPRIAVFDGTSIGAGRVPSRLVADFFAFEDTLRNGAFVAVGDINGDGFGDLVLGGGPGGGPRVRIADAKQLLGAGAFGTLDNVPNATIANFFAGNEDNRGGIRLAVKDLDGDQFADLVTGAGTGAGSQIVSFLGKNLIAGNTTNQFDLNTIGDFDGGIFVG